MMSTVHLRLPDDLRSSAEARAAQEGFPSLDQYIASLIRTDQRNDAPAELAADSTDCNRCCELASISGPGREISDVQWEQKQQSLIARHRKTLARQRLSQLHPVLS